MKSKINLDYIAGFLDGEGCITSFYDKRWKNQVMTRILIVNNDKAILEKIQKFLDSMNISSGIYPQTNKTSFCLQIAAHEDVLKFAELMLDRCIVKKRALLDAIKIIKKQSWHNPIISKYDRDKVESLYWKGKMSLPEIARFYNTSTYNVWNFFRRMGIPRRSKSEALKLKYSRKTLK